MLVQTNLILHPGGNSTSAQTNVKLCRKKPNSVDKSRHHFQLISSPVLSPHTVRIFNYMARIYIYIYETTSLCLLFNYC